MNLVVVGALAMGFAVAGLFFLRFWRESRDRLFLFFAISFFVLSASRLRYVWLPEHDVRGGYFYWVRLLAFAVILLAILDKNLRRPSYN